MAAALLQKAHGGGQTIMGRVGRCRPFEQRGRISVHQRLQAVRTDARPLFNDGEEREGAVAAGTPSGDRRHRALLVVAVIESSPQASSTSRGRREATGHAQYYSPLA